jgi:phosphatidate cytidylyltransferase
MINRLNNSSRHSMGTRILTGIVLMAVLIPCTIFGNWAFFVMMTVLALFGIHEIVSAPGSNRYDIVVRGVVFLFILSFIYWVYIKNWIGQRTVFNGYSFFLTDIFVSISGIVLYALTLFLIAIITPKIQLSDVTYLFTIGLLFALGIQGMFFLRYFPNSAGFLRNSSQTIIPFWSTTPIFPSAYLKDFYAYKGINQTFASSLLFFYMLIGTWASDVGAYFVGVFFGKHRMNPRISPHKTWEGFFGGLVFSMAASLGFAAVMEYGFGLPLVPGLIQFRDSEFLLFRGVMAGHSFPFLILLSFAMPIIGNMGGFLYSLVKRQYGIKDFGKLFPGHGGVIDRFDSVMINSIVMSIIVLMTSNGWNFLV